MKILHVFRAMMIAGVYCLMAFNAAGQPQTLPNGADGQPVAPPEVAPAPVAAQDAETPQENATPEAAPAPPQQESEPTAPAPAPVAPNNRALPARPRLIRPPMRSGGIGVGGERRVPGQPPAPTSAASPSPSAAQQKTNVNSPKEGEKPNEPVAFDCQDSPLTEVVASLSRMTGKNFDVDPTIASTHVTIIMHDKIPPEMAYEVLESILNARGFSLIPTLDGKLVRIVPTGESMDKVHIQKGNELKENFDTLATHVVSVKNADAAELAGILKSLGSKSAMVDAYARTNTLIMTDTADGLHRMFTFLEEVDIPGYDTQMEMFTLEYARAEDLGNQIEEVLMGNGSGGGNTPRPAGAAAQPVRPTAPVRVPSRANVPGQSAPMVVGSKEETLRIVPDERLNTIIVIATASLMDRVRELVKKLDTPTPYEANNMNVYKLLNAPADKVEEALNAILGSTPRQAAEKAPSQSGEVQPFEKKVLVTRYEQINALLVLASPQDYKLIKEIIAQLDVPQRQVLVESVIMDVSLQNTYGLSVDTASVTGNDAFGLGNTSNIDSLVSVTDLATGLSNGTAGLLTAKKLLSLGSSGGMAVGMFDQIETTINGKHVKIPFVPLLVKALESLTDVDILSQPSLTTQDNEEANIVVGQELPVPTMRSGYSYTPTSSSTTTTASTYSNYLTTSYGGGISREDVGVKMKVTPHINEGDYVSLETEIEVSEATASSVGINANELGPTFNKSKVTNNVVVKDGSTGVIGGLIKETTSHSRSKTPALSDVPVLGFLFRSSSNVRKKQNVVVLVTPYIVKEGVDLDRVSEYKMDEFRDANVDVLFEKGFIKKIKKNNYMNNDYRPSVERAQRMKEQKKSFGQGKVER